MGQCHVSAHRLLEDHSLLGAEAEGGPRLEDVDPEILRTFEKLAIPLEEQIPVNIYELGLIYGIAVEPTGAVTVRMTLTAAGCPAAQALPQEVEERVRAVPGVTNVKIDLVFDPPWDQSRMSEAARLQLAALSRTAGPSRVRE